MVAPQQPFDATAAIIFGGGGHGAMMADTLLPQKTWRIVGVLDDGAAVETEVVPGVKVIGGRQLLAELQTQGVRLAFNAVAGLDQPEEAARNFEYLAAEGFGFPAMIHESAHVESSAKIGAGAQIFGGAFVGPLKWIRCGGEFGCGGVPSLLHRHLLPHRTGCGAGGDGEGGCRSAHWYGHDGGPEIVHR